MEYIVLGLIVAVIAYVMLRKRPASGSGSRMAVPGGGAIAHIRGHGRYDVDVVGESHYAASFATLAQRHKPDDTEDESFGDAVLTLEDTNPHDAQAVAVSLEGLPVGYLSRDMARDFRQAIARAGLGKHRRFAVGARLYWGGDDGIFSVQLDLPLA